jgi:hypothetical protein
MSISRCLPPGQALHYSVSRVEPAADVIRLIITGSRGQQAVDPICPKDHTGRKTLVRSINLASCSLRHILRSVSNCDIGLFCANGTPGHRVPYLDDGIDDTGMRVTSKDFDFGMCAQSDQLIL